MNKSKLAKTALLLIAATTLTGTVLVQYARAQSSLHLYLFAPSTATPGQTIGIELWTIYENVTSGRPDLAFNATRQSLTFLVKINLGISVPPHVHTPGGNLVPLPAFKQWVHPGAWNTSYTVPSQLGLYGVHMYANYTVQTGPNTYTSYVTQAQTTFTVTNPPTTPATSSDVSNSVSGLASQNLSYAILGLVVIAIVLDVVILVWKKPTAKMP